MKILSFFKYNHATIYIISQDTLFIKDIEKQIRERHTTIDLIKNTTGEGFFQNLTFNPPKEKTTTLILLDYNLKSRDYINAQNGIAILKEIKKKYPNWEVVLFAPPQDMKIKRDALRKGAKSFIVKNNNSVTRLMYIIQNILNKKKLEFEKRLTRIVYIGIFSIASFLSVLGAYIYKLYFA